MDNQKFGQFILSLRKKKGWTQLELAEKLNVTDKAFCDSGCLLYTSDAADELDEV